MSIFGSIVGMVQAGKAARAGMQANNDAMQGVLGSTQGAVTGVQEAVSGGQQAVNQAGDAANGLIDARLADIRGQLNPYMAAGQQGIASLADYARDLPKFSFNPQDLENDPGYQFQLQQGQQAVTGKASAAGLGLSGNTQKALMDYGTGLAGTYYQQAFDRAKSAYDTNQNATLATLQSLIAPGLQATGMFSGANQSMTGMQSNNITDLAQFRASLGLQGAQTAGQFGMQGSKWAGDYRVGQSSAERAGDLAIGNNIAQLGSDVASLFVPGAGGLKGALKGGKIF